MLCCIKWCFLVEKEPQGYPKHASHIFKHYLWQKHENMLGNATCLESEQASEAMIFLPFVCHVFPKTMQKETNRKDQI